MDFVYKRPINYYETDKMGIVHHSNYIRFLEEARGYYFDELNMPFVEYEKNNVTIPVLGVNCTYKHHVTYGDTLLIKVFIKKYNGVRLTVSYDVRDEKTNETVIIAETKHCFTNIDLKPINLKKYIPEFHEKFEKLSKIV
ncbi:MAG: acyl-CoA thioesterase [Clostridia bacterium]|nr:acyl-CoA thioesterase [Clostridia bacterium]